MVGDNKSGRVDEKAEYMNKFVRSDAAASRAGGQNQCWELFVFLVFLAFFSFFSFLYFQ